MPSSHQGGPVSNEPLRSPGRNFLSSDPERQREVTSGGARTRDERHSAHATQARTARNSVNVGRAPSHGSLWDSDDEGGSGRRSR
jgi:hypothetical protein